MCHDEALLMCHAVALESYGLKRRLHEPRPTSVIPLAVDGALTLNSGARRTINCYLIQDLLTLHVRKVRYL